jgi:hypothetical protein
MGEDDWANNNWERNILDIKLTRIRLIIGSLSTNAQQVVQPADDYLNRLLG